MWSLPQVLLLALAVLVFGTGQTTEAPNQAATCIPPFVSVGDGCYYFHETKMAWHDARHYCRSMNGTDLTADLATAASCDQHSHIWQHILVEYGNVAHWLGGFDEGQEGSWHWVTGEAMAMGLPFWYPGYPFNHPDYDCLLNHGTYGYFVASNCTVTQRFVCQQF